MSRSTEAGMGYAYQNLLSAVANYCRAWEKHHGQAIGADGYADEYMVDILKAMIGLLSTEIGHLDGGTMDSAIRALAARCELLNANGEIES